MAVAAGIQDRDPRTKPFLGGWRNTTTGLIYHNASTQTPHGTTTNRITQTVAVVDAVTEVVRDQAVQVHFLPDARDRIIAPGVFSPSTAAEKAELLSRQGTSRILDRVFKIQRYYR